MKNKNQRKNKKGEKEKKITMKNKKEKELAMKNKKQRKNEKGEKKKAITMKNKKGKEIAMKNKKQRKNKKGKEIVMKNKNQRKNKKGSVNKNKTKMLSYLIIASSCYILVSGGLVYQQSKKDKLNTFAKETETVQNTKETDKKQQEVKGNKQKDKADENKEAVKKAIHQKANEIVHSESTEENTLENKTNDQENNPALNQTQQETQNQEEVVIPQEENTYSDGGVNFFGEYFPLLYMPKILQEEGEPPIYIPADEYVRYHTIQKDHLMIEHVTRQSELLRQMGVGDTFYYNGRKYQITQAHRFVPNDPYQAGNAVELTLYYDSADFENITLHTCETMQFNSPQGLWVAQPL